jgi:hypothetical protein
VNGTPSLLEVALRVARALAAAQVPYVLGGSVATSLQGEPRATRDIDFAVHLIEAQVPTLVAALGTDFDADEEALREAARLRRSTNIFYLPAVTKVDLFVRGNEGFDRSEMERRVYYQPIAGEASIAVATPEDNLLRKLAWFRSGGEISDQQWRDILGLLRSGRSTLDRSYLASWAPVLGVSDLLERAFAQAWP